MWVTENCRVLGANRCTHNGPCAKENDSSPSADGINRRQYRLVPFDRLHGTGVRATVVCTEARHAECLWDECECPCHVAALRADLAIAHTACTETERDMAETIAALKDLLQREVDAHGESVAELEQIRAELARAKRANRDHFNTALKWKAKVERMQPVVDVACRLVDAWSGIKQEGDVNLGRAVDAYRATSEQEATDG